MLFCDVFFFSGMDFFLYYVRLRFFDIRQGLWQFFKCQIIAMLSARNLYDITVVNQTIATK